MLRLIPPRHFLLPLHHQGTYNCYFQTLQLPLPQAPDLITYPLLTHLPIQLSNIFFPSSTGPGLLTPFPPAGNLPPLSPINKPGKPADPPASYRPISLTSRISKLFKHLLLNCLCYYLESKNLISSTQAGFQPGRSTIDQVLLLLQSIWDRFQKKRPPNRTVLATIDFSKAFDSV